MEKHLHKKPKQQQQQQHYVFGYGSLICPESRARTAQALRGGGNQNGVDGAESADGAIPVRLNHWVRLWNTQGHHTYLGVQHCPTIDKGTKDEAKTEAEGNDPATRGNRRHPPSARHSCVGVLVPLPYSGDLENNDVLEALDRREHAYKREKVDLGSIERVDDLLLGEYDGSEEEQRRRKQAIHDRYYKDTFWATQQRPYHGNDNDEAYIGTGNEEESGETETPDKFVDPDEVCVWIYVPLEKYRMMALPDKPILQSYLDICIKGCLSISKAFAREFVKGTYGWYPGHSHEPSGHDNGDPNHSDPSWSCWMDDRNDPIYVRADKEYSLKHSKSLDNAFHPLLLRWRGPMVQKP